MVYTYNGKSVRYENKKVEQKKYTIINYNNDSFYDNWNQSGLFWLVEY